MVRTITSSFWLLNASRANDLSILVRAIGSLHRCHRQIAGNEIVDRDLHAQFARAGNRLDRKVKPCMAIAPMTRARFLPTCKNYWGETVSVAWNLHYS